MDTDAWKSDAPRHDELGNVLEKEKIIKDMMSTREGLKALLDRIDDVSGDIKRLTDDNATLQLYVENMTRNTAMLGAKQEKR